MYKQYREAGSGTTNMDVQAYVKKVCIDNVNHEHLGVGGKFEKIRFGFVLSVADHMRAKLE